MPFDSAPVTLTVFPFAVSAHDLAYLHSAEFAREVAPKYRNLYRDEARIVYQQGWTRAKRILNGIPPLIYQLWLEKKPIRDEHKKILDTTPRHMTARYFAEYNRGAAR